MLRIEPCFTVSTKGGCRYRKGRVMATIDAFPNELIEADAALAIKAGVTVENGLSLSIAISQKRIADALWGIEGTSGLLELLNPLQVRNSY